MDLSKIPEPSEGELAAMASFLNPREDYYGPISCVIASFLRHGSVLAKNIDIEMVDSEQIGRVMAAIGFFEKFGGSVSEERIKLPRVQPEDLIDGEWYEIREGGERLIVRYSRSLGQFRGAYGDQPWDGEDAKSVRPVFGPIPEFELEGK